MDIYATGGFTYTATFNLGFNDQQAITDAVGVTIDQNITIQRFTLLGGIVTGDFNLTLLDNLAWSGYGGLLGTGTTSVAGANSTISGIPNKFLSRTLNNSGTITFTGSGQGTGTVLFGVGSPSRPGVINNSGTFNTTANAGFSFFNFSTGHAINNSGTWNVAAAGTISSVQGIAFNTPAQLVTSGELRLSGGGMSTGSFALASGAALNFSDGTFLVNNGTSFSGPGVANVHR